MWVKVPFVAMLAITKFFLLYFGTVVKFLIIIKLFINTWLLQKFCLIIIILIKVVLSAAYLVLWERRLIAAIQRRRGPNVVAKGYLQPIADALKSLFKTNLRPFQSNRFLFILAPGLVLFFSLLLWAFIPFYGQKTIYASEYSIIYIYMVSSFIVFALILAGWASSSKYPLLGAIRAAAQIISYEVCLGIVLVFVIFVTISADFISILDFQRTYINLFFLIPVVGVIIFISLLAELNRTPFDLPEAEAELVAGYNLEYSGILFAIFMLAEYANIIFIGLFYVYLIWGDSLIYYYVIESVFFFMYDIICYIDIWLITLFASSEIISDDWVAAFNVTIIIDKIIIYGVLFFLTIFVELWIFVKVIIFLFILIIIRAHLPRYRFDQLIQLCWIYFLPILLFLYFVFILVVFLESII
jgi:NADH:ubiquinone oxidoreductase subunit H